MGAPPNTLEELLGIAGLKEEELPENPYRRRIVIAYIERMLNSKGEEYLRSPEGRLGVRIILEAVTTI